MKQDDASFDQHATGIARLAYSFGWLRWYVAVENWTDRVFAGAYILEQDI
jgi:hypothetical protein